MEAAAGLVFVFIGLGVTLPIALVLGAIMFFVGLGIRKARKQQRELANAPMVKVNKLADGLHKLKATIHAQDRLLRSPLSRRKCVYYQFKVEEQRTHTSGSGRHRTTHTVWHTIVDDKDWVDFTVEDKTGEADIDVQGAEVTLTTKAFTNSGTFNSAPPELEDLMRDRYGKSTKGWIFNKTMRYTESYLRDGDEVLVVGDVKTKKGYMPEFQKGEHYLVVTDMTESQLSSTYTSKTVWSWVILGFLGFFMLLVCGGGLAFSAVGLGIGGLGLAQRDGPKPRGNDLKPADPIAKPKDKPADPLVAKPRPINPGWVDAKMNVVFLSDLPEQNPIVGWGQFGKNGLHGYVPEGTKDANIIVQGKRHPKALSLHPPANGESSVQYRLNRQYKLLKARVGLHDLPAGVTGAASQQTFKALGDGDLLWLTDKLQAPGDVREVRISVENVDMLELRIHSTGHNRHAWTVWLDPQVLR